MQIAAPLLDAHIKDNTITFADGNPCVEYVASFPSKCHIPDTLCQSVFVDAVSDAPAQSSLLAYGTTVVPFVIFPKSLFTH